MTLSRQSLPTRPACRRPILYSIDVTLTHAPTHLEQVADRLLITMSACRALLASAHWWISEHDLDDAESGRPWVDVHSDIHEQVLTLVYRAAQFKSPGLDLLLIAAAEPRYGPTVSTTQLRIALNGPRSRAPSSVMWELLPPHRIDNVAAAHLIQRIWGW